MFIALPLPLANEPRLALVIEHLCRTIAAHVARDRTAGPLILLVWNAVRRRANRLAALLVLFRAGRLPAPRVRASQAGRERMRDRTPPPVRLPRSVGWLARLVPGAGGWGEQLRVLLDEAEMAALIAASPQARRLLRPLCSMLGVNPTPAGLERVAAVPREVLEHATGSTTSTTSGGGILGRMPVGTPDRARTRVVRARRRDGWIGGVGRFSKA